MHSRINTQKESSNNESGRNRFDLQKIQEFTVENILPSVSIDEGDLRAEKLEGNTVTFGTYAECSIL